jgi:hypothetical protein
MKISLKIKEISKFLLAGLAGRGLENMGDRGG